jgi:hypothetical protein
MLYKKRCPEDTPVIPVIYEFLEPVRIRILVSQNPKLNTR